MLFANENAFDAVITAAAGRHGIPPALFKGLIAHESKFNPGAVRGEVKLGDRSHGLTQILLATAKGEGYTGDSAGLFDPATNVEYGARYLARQYRRVGGNWPAALSAYNGGYRPTLAFGQRATAPGRVCLARSQTTGDCIRWHSYSAGEFGNQPYVDTVLRYAAHYGYGANLPPAPSAPLPPSSPKASGPTTAKPATGGGGPMLPIALIVLVALWYVAFRHQQ